MVEKESKKAKETTETKQEPAVNTQAFVNKKLAILAEKSGVKFTAISNRLTQNNLESDV